MNALEMITSSVEPGSKSVDCKSPWLSFPLGLTNTVFRPRSEFLRQRIHGISVHQGRSSLAVYPDHNDNNDEFYDPEVHDLLVFSVKGCWSEVSGTMVPERMLPIGRVSRDVFIKLCWKLICGLELDRLLHHRTPRSPDVNIDTVEHALREELR